MFLNKKLTKILFNFKATINIMLKDYILRINVFLIKKTYIYIIILIKQEKKLKVK